MKGRPDSLLTAYGRTVTNPSRRRCSPLAGQPMPGELLLATAPRACFAWRRRRVRLCARLRLTPNRGLFNIARWGESAHDVRSYHAYFAAALSRVGHSLNYLRYSLSKPLDRADASYSGSVERDTRFGGGAAPSTRADW
jgi:hypothetical protein